MENDRIRASPSVEGAPWKCGKNQKNWSGTPFHLCRIRFIAFQIGLSRYSGAIYQDVDRRKPIEHLDYFFPICHITHHRDKVLAQSDFQLLQLGLVDIDPSHVCVQECKTCANGATESRCSPGYNNILRLPVPVHANDSDLPTLQCHSQKWYTGGKFVSQVLLCFGEIELVDHEEFAAASLFNLADQQRI